MLHTCGCELVRSSSQDPKGKGCADVDLLVYAAYVCLRTSINVNSHDPKGEECCADVVLLVYVAYMCACELVRPSTQDLK